MPASKVALVFPESQFSEASSKVVLAFPASQFSEDCTGSFIATPLAAGPMVFPERFTDVACSKVSLAFPGPQFSEHSREDESVPAAAGICSGATGGITTPLAAGPLVFPEREVFPDVALLVV